MNTVRVDVLGNSFSVQTDEDPAYFATLLEHFRGLIDEVAAQTKAKDPLRLATLAALLMADELFKAREARADRADSDPAGQSPVAAEEEAERIALRLIADIEEKLP